METRSHRSGSRANYSGYKMVAFIRERHLSNVGLASGLRIRYIVPRKNAQKRSSCAFRTTPMGALWVRRANT